MKKIILIIFLFSVLICYSETIKETYFSPQIYLSNPTGHFDNTVGDDAGFAQKGFGAGLEYSDETGIRSLYWMMQTAVILNDFDEYNLFKYWYDVEADIGFWINIPILGGFKYGLLSTDKVRILPSGFLGINIIKAPDWHVELDGIRTTADFDWSYDFACGLSLEIIYLNKYSFGIKTLDLGKPEFEYTVESGNSMSNEMTLKQPVSMTIFFLGYIL